MSKDYFRKFITSLRFQLATGAVFLLVGVTAFGLFWVNTDHIEKSATKPQPESKVLKNTPAPKTDQSPVSGTPVRISIPEVGINLNVIPGYYDLSSNSWTLSLNNAQWGSMTAPANNQAGDTFIYAHARVGVFASLPRVKPGDQAIITTSNGHSFTYSFIVSTITTPSDTSLFNYKGKPILVLQTCTGTWWQDRQLFVFDLSKVS